MKFNETKSQERLINLMLQAGVEWPKKASHAIQGGRFGKVLFSSVKPKSVKPEGSARVWNLTMAGPATNINHKPLPNWHQTIITREQYEARDGWITWHGGECPVDKKKYVQVITAFDQAEPEVSMARHFAWKQRHTRIVAYRIHKDRPASEPCESAKACIPDQPTIEQLIAEWKKKDAVVGQEERKLEEQQASLENAKRRADKAKKAVDDAILAAGYFVGGSVVEAEQPVITDWRDLRVGDVIECTEDRPDHYNGLFPGGWARENIGTVNAILGINEYGRIQIDSKSRLEPVTARDSGYGFKFIRRTAKGGQNA